MNIILVIIFVGGGGVDIAFSARRDCETQATYARTQPGVVGAFCVDRGWK